MADRCGDFGSRAGAAPWHSGRCRISSRETEATIRAEACQDRAFSRSCARILDPYPPCIKWQLTSRLVHGDGIAGWGSVQVGEFLMRDQGTEQWHDLQSDGDGGQCHIGE